MPGDTLFLIETLGFAVGTGLFALLLGLFLKARRIAGPSYPGIALVALCLVWNVGRLVQDLQLLLGLGDTWGAEDVATTIAYGALAGLPTAFLVLLRVSSKTRGWRRASLALLVPTSVVTAVFLAVFLALGSDRYNAVRLIGFNQVAHLVLITIVFFGVEWRSREYLLFFRWSWRISAALSATLLALLLDALPHSWEPFVGSLAQQSPLFWAIATFMLFSRFRFADVFVKRSLVLMTAVLLSVAYHFEVVEPLSRLVPEPEIRGARTILAVGLWSALLAVFPAIARGVDRCTDRLIFRRPDYGALLRGFSATAVRTGSEAELEAVTGELLKSALGAENVRFLAPASNLDGLDPCVPVATDRGVEKLLVLDTGSGGVRLLSGEKRFLDELAEILAQRLVALRLAEELRDQALARADLQRALVEAELKALQAQIDPHFLFNTLNTIADLVRTDPGAAESVTEELAALFRSVLARSENGTVTLEEEFEFLRRYLGIERVRFGERLSVDLALDEAVGKTRVPAFLLQPLVENSIRHGLAPKLGPVSVSVHVSAEPEGIRVTVVDDGVGWAAAELTAARAGIAGDEGSIGANGSQFGLRNVAKRLHGSYGPDATMDIDPDAGGGSRIVLFLPTNDAQDPAHR